MIQRDFTLKAYTGLLTALKRAGYSFVTFEEFCGGMQENRFVILRHDVDLNAERSLETAKIEHAAGVRASYYFRVVPQSNKPDIIRQIAALGHEIGYHYEDLSLLRGDGCAAIAHFEKQLAHFRQFYPVRTVCMHGSPTSRIDNRSIWQSYDYRSFGIIGEPYFDIDFRKVFYLTDTGRSWDGGKYSVRDKVESAFDLRFRTTGEIIKAARCGSLPDRIMITTHPQRWTNSPLPWLKEYLLQSMKNVVKRIYITLKSK